MGRPSDFHRSHHCTPPGLPLERQPRPALAQLPASGKSAIGRAERRGRRECCNRNRNVRLGRRSYAAPELQDGVGQSGETVRGPWWKRFSAASNQREWPRPSEELAQIVLGSSVVIAE